MKITASILDFSYPSLDPAVWGQDMHLFAYQRDFILRLTDKMYETYSLKEHEKWVTDVVILGSLTTSKWLLSSDLDVHIRVNLDAFIESNMPGTSKEEAFAKLDEVRKEFDRAKILLPMTQHPAEFYFESADIKSSNEDMVGVYSLMQDKWLKEPILFEASLDLEESKKSVVDQAEALAKELDSNIGVIKRDIQRVNELETVIKAWDKKKQQLFYNKIETKLNNIEEEIKKDLKIKQDLVDARHEKMSATSDTELTFKYLQRYGFFGILSRLKDLLEEIGGEVTTEDLPLIEKVISEASLEVKSVNRAAASWIDPNGKAYYLDDSNSVTHFEWIFDNKELLGNEYGYKDLDSYVKSTGDDVNDVDAYLTSKDWSRIGDVSHSEWGIEVGDISDLPQGLLTYLISMPWDDKLNFYVEDISGSYVQVNLGELRTEGQKAVNRALSHKRLQHASLDKQARVLDVPILNGKYNVRVWQDPSRAQIEALLSKLSGLRWVRDSATGSLFVWDANKAPHLNIIWGLGIDRKDYDANRNYGEIDTKQSIDKALGQKQLQTASLKQAFLKEAFEEEPKECETDICIDLDKTIAQDAEYPKIGEPIEGAKEALAKFKEMGYNIVIYSCRGDTEEGLELVREWLDKYEIPFDSIFEGKKPFSKYFIDDKAIKYTSWSDVLKQVEKSDKIASLHIVADSRYWIDPSGKVYPVPHTHEDWFFENKELLQKQYGYVEDTAGQSWWDIKTINLLRQLLNDGWLRVGDLFTIGGEGEHYGNHYLGQGIEIADINNAPQTLFDFVSQWGKDKYFMIEDLRRRYVELPVEELMADGQEAINRAMQRGKMVHASFDLPVVDPKTYARKDPYALFIGTQWDAKHIVPLDLFNIYPMVNADNGVPTVGLQTLVDKNIPIIGKEPRAGDKQPAQDISSVIKLASLDKKADVVEISTTYSRGEFPVLIDPTEDEELKLIQKSQYDELRYLDGYNGVTYVWDAYRSTHAEVAQELHYRGFDVDTNSPRGTISQNNGVALEMEASLKKEASYDHAYWIDPAGKTFPVRGEGVTAEDMNKNLNTHSDWVRANIDMLVKEYGFKPKPVKSTELFSMPLTSNDLIEAGWIRIGDSSGGSEWGVTLKDLNNIPSSVDNLLAQFVPEGAKITIEEDTSWQNHVQIEWPVNSVQLAVNQARRQQPVMASKAFSKKEIVAEQKSPMIEYACVMADIPKEISQEIVEFGVRNVKDGDIYMKDGLLGRELDSHITIKYGIISDDFKEIEKLFKGIKQFKATLGEVKHFSPEEREFDVLTVSVESKDLSDMNEKITKEIKCATGLPSDEYHPHVTIAYIKKGKCKELYSNKEFMGKEIIIDSVEFSPVKGDKISIELGNKKEAAYRGNMDIWLAPDGKEYSTTRSHTTWIVDEANLLKTEYGLTLPAEGSPEDDNLISWLLSKGWVRVSGLLPVELDLLIQDINNIPQAAEQFVWKYKPEVVIVEDLNHKDISFDREEYSKGMMKHASGNNFLPSLVQAPNNEWQFQHGGDDQEIPVDPDSQSDQETLYEPCTTGKPRSADTWRQFLSIFKQPLSKKENMTVEAGEAEEWDSHYGDIWHVGDKVKDKVTGKIGIIKSINGTEVELEEVEQ